jgi:hypothetical protein
MIDADEIPQENLIKSLKKSIASIDGVDLLQVPRINLCPGYTQEWLKKHNFTINEAGWIFWPDYQGRIFKNSPEIRWNNALHEKVTGYKKAAAFPADPELGLWHVKTVQRQDKQGSLYDEIQLKTTNVNK